MKTTNPTDKKIINEFKERFGLQEYDSQTGWKPSGKIVNQEGFEQFLLEKLEEVYQEGFKNGFKDCQDMIKRGEHVHCCLKPDSREEQE